MNDMEIRKKYKEKEEYLRHVSEKKTARIDPHRHNTYFQVCQLSYTYNNHC